MSSRALQKVIRNALSNKSCRFGSREVLGSVKNKKSKLIVRSSSLPADAAKEIMDAAGSSKVPVYNFADTSVELGRLCNRPFRVSVLSVDSADDSISELLAEAK